MIIGIDGTCMQGARTAVGWHLTHLLEALSHVLEEDRVYVWMNNPTPEERARVNENRFVSVSATHYPWGAIKLTWNTLGSPAIDTLIGRPADIYFYATPFPPPQKQGKKAIFVHDLTYLTNPDLASQEEVKNFGPSLEKQGEKADLILTCSEFNRQTMLKHLRQIPENKVRVIPHGLPETFRKPAPAEQIKAVREKYRLPRPYFLFVGTLEPRKNLLRLVHAFLLFKQRVQAGYDLVLAGPRGGAGEDFMHFIQAPQLTDKVHWLENVQDGDLTALHSGAEAFVFPSVKEGWGEPMLEAMGCGVPVLCSNTGAFPEVVGDAAWMVDPANVAEWSLALQRVVTEPAFGQLLREKGKTRISLFRMENTAKQTLTALKQAVHG